MRLAVLACFVLAGLAGNEAVAQQSYESCSDIADNTLRLDCFDRAARDNKTSTAGPSQPNETATTKDVLNGFSPNEYKVVDPDDMFVSPNKFKGKPVELRNVQCFFADKDDYRCLAAGESVVMVQSTNVTPENAKDRLENDCGSIKMLETPRCRRTIRFVPMISEEDQVNAFRKKQSFGTISFEVVPGR